MKGFDNEFTYRKFLDSGKEEEFDSLFDGAVEKVKREVLGKSIPIYIGSREVYEKEEIVEYSPIDRKIVIGRFQKGTRETARQAIEIAEKAFEPWRDMDYRDRADIFRKAAGEFSENKFEIGAILSIENGKTRYESIGEVDEAIDFLNYYALEMEKSKGYVRRTTLSSTDSKVSKGFQGAPGSEEKISIVMKPYGVFGVIAPFNFPISISVGMSTGALITGNTVVFKPSSTDNMAMMTGFKIYQMFKNAGVPEGAFNYVTGPGSEVGDELVASDSVKGIVFTGSKAAGLGMMKKVYSSEKMKVFVVEMGGKNAAIVSKHADIDKAVSGVASAAFGFDGQKCSACSRVYVQKDVRDEFVRKLVEKVRTFRVGDPLKKENYVGPLISDKAFIKYGEYVEEAKRDGKLLFGGNAVDAGIGGFYVEPTLVELNHKHRLFHTELFVPILAIAAYDRFEDALKMANDVEYGLTSGCYTNKKGEIRKYLDSIEAGVVYVNREISATTGAIVGFQTFVGWKGSGLTGKGTGSRFYLQQFLREQSQTIVKH